MKNTTEITLPPLTSGSPSTLTLSSGGTIIIGANGAGKSRFAARMISDMGNNACCLSALNALFVRNEPSQESDHIDHLYNQAVADGMPHSQLTTQFERIMALLMRDEMLNLIRYKLNHAENPDEQLNHTHLDDVIALWQEIFPKNKVLIESGKFLFSQRKQENDKYSAMKLSAGERAVMYYIGAVAFAPRRSVIFVDSPELFLHPTIMQSVWNRVENLRPDCSFIYTTHDLDFASSRSQASIIWVRNFDAASLTWDYRVLPPNSPISEDIYLSIIGARKPVLFIEGDAKRSIDAKLYPLIFKDFSIRSLGSCNKVIESTRTFNDLNAFHQLDSYGIVDRDRRDAKEVEYLRGKKVMVPEVAEVENILMLEDVICAVASYKGKDPTRVFLKVKQNVITQFSQDLRQQALLHTRHRVKRTVEYRIDGRFTNINMLEQHMQNLMHEINPRGLYDNFCQQFRRYVSENDYRSILRVYNQKSMLPNSNVAGLCGLHNKEDYLNTILRILRTNAPQAKRISDAIRRCFNIGQTSSPIESSHS